MARMRTSCRDLLQELILATSHTHGLAKGIVTGTSPLQGLHEETIFIASSRDNPIWFLIRFFLKFGHRNGAHKETSTI